MELELTDREKMMLLRTARESIASHLEGRTGDYPEATERIKTVCGAFVTLHEGEDLRGCIGNISGTKPLIDGIRELAVSSAFRDPRFPPLHRDELEQVDIEISVLTPLEKASSPDEVEVGRHGIMMRSGPRSGILLPQVPIEQGWDREQFLDQTCRKAGLPAGCWQEEQTEIFLFSAIVFGEKDFKEERRQR